MKAYVVEAPGLGRVLDVPEPNVGDYDALVRMRACGVCNTTDRMVREGRFPRELSLPSILGHESVGEVTWIGSMVRNLAVGDLVTRASAYVDSNDPPLNQNWGGFAERGVVRDWQAELEDAGHGVPGSRSIRSRLVPSGLNPVEAALGICLSETRSTIPASIVGSQVVVVGTGIAGLSYVDHAKRMGAACIVTIGRRQSRLDLARSLGSDFTFLADRSDLVQLVQEATGSGAHFAFEASGDPLMVVTAAQCCRPGGEVSIYGLSSREVGVRWDELPVDVSVRAVKTDEASYYTDVANELLVGERDASRFVSHRASFLDIDAAIAVCDAGESLKTVITFD